MDSEDFQTLVICVAIVILFAMFSHSCNSWVTSQEKIRSSTACFEQTKKDKCWLKENE